jgi:S-adenosylhomocysteine hydrolase
MTPDLEANGPYVVARRGDTTQQVADCSVSPHGAEYARLFAQSIKMRAALQALMDNFDKASYDEAFAMAQEVLAATGKGE